ncbi:MAG: hypothetical protein QOJ01_1859 [Solirubrobacterales bacterium]|jgi:SAM-dependent methyltransferase|nr:hypothetical protein [Solirubrobacterales bacterium]
MTNATTPANELAIWHDVECGAYHADLRIWADLAVSHPGPILELGAGTGRVALALAELGHEVTAIDTAPVLLEVLAERAAAAHLAVETVAADVRTLDFGRGFGLVIAPLQLLQVLGSAGDRGMALSAIRRHLSGGAVGAAAIVEGPPAPGSADATPDPLPDLREVDGWVYSSLPVDVRVDGSTLEATRLRQRVSPGGELSEQVHIDRFAVLDAGELDAEARAAGMEPAGRRVIPDDESFVGSTICVWRAAS